jgi:hypothetical protein
MCGKFFARAEHEKQDKPQNCEKKQKEGRVDHFFHMEYDNFCFGTHGARLLVSF